MIFWMLPNCLIGSSFVPLTFAACLWFITLRIFWVHLLSKYILICLPGGQNTHSTTEFYDYFQCPPWVHTLVV